MKTQYVIINKEEKYMTVQEFIDLFSEYPKDVIIQFYKNGEERDFTIYYSENLEIPEVQIELA